MALTFAAAIAEIRTTVASVAGIRQVFVSEPAAVNHPPVAYIAGIEISHARGPGHVKLYRDLAEVTVRVLLSSADGDDAETDAFALEALILTAFRPGVLSDVESSCEPLRSVFGTVTLGDAATGTRYRALDVVIQLEMFRAP